MSVYWLIEDMLRDAAAVEDHLESQLQIDAIVLYFQIAAYHIGGMYFVGPDAQKRVMAYVDTCLDGRANIKITEPWDEDPTVTTTRVVIWC